MSSSRCGQPRAGLAVLFHKVLMYLDSFLISFLLNWGWEGGSSQPEARSPARMSVPRATEWGQDRRDSARALWARTWPQGHTQLLGKQAFSGRPCSKRDIHLYGGGGYAFVAAPGGLCRALPGSGEDLPTYPPPACPGQPRLPRPQEARLRWQPQTVLAGGGAEGRQSRLQAHSGQTPELWTWLLWEKNKGVGPASFIARSSVSSLVLAHCFPVCSRCLTVNAARCLNTPPKEGISALNFHLSSKYL